MKRTTITLVSAVALSAASLTSIGVGTADASSVKYIERPCLTRSIAADGGLYGDGCAVYGIGRWVSTGKRGGMPDQMKQDIRNCLVEGGIAAVTAWFGGPAVYSGTMAVLGVACVGPSVARMLVQ